MGLDFFIFLSHIFLSGWPWWPRRRSKPRCSILDVLYSILYPLSSILYPLSSILYPLSSILYPLSRGLLHRNQLLNRLPSPRVDGFFTAGFVSSWESVGVVESGSMDSCPLGKMAGSSIASLSVEGVRGVEKAK